MSQWLEILDITFKCLLVRDIPISNLGDVNNAGIYQPLLLDMIGIMNSDMLSRPMPIECCGWAKSCIIDNGINQFFRPQYNVPIYHDTIDRYCGYLWIMG